MFNVKNGEEFKYDFSENKFKVAFDFLKRKDLASLNVGVINLGYGTYAKIQHYTTGPASDFDFETHKKYFDIQYQITGQEMLGLYHGNLKEKTAYDVKEDVTFFYDPVEFSKILLNADEFVIFTPEDAHKPRCFVDKPMAVKKIVIKVPV